GNRPLSPLPGETQDLPPLPSGCDRPLGFYLPACRLPWYRHQLHYQKARYAICSLKSREKLQSYRFLRFLRFLRVSKVLGLNVDFWRPVPACRGSAVGFSAAPARQSPGPSASSFPLVFQRLWIL